MWSVYMLQMSDFFGKQPAFLIPITDVSDSRRWREAPHQRRRLAFVATDNRDILFTHQRQPQFPANVSRALDHPQAAFKVLKCPVRYWSPVLRNKWSYILTRGSYCLVTNFLPSSVGDLEGCTMWRHVSDNRHFVKISFTVPIFWASPLNRTLSTTYRFCHETCKDWVPTSGWL